jgi:hypothetical protein
MIQRYGAVGIDGWPAHSYVIEHTNKQIKAAASYRQLTTGCRTTACGPPSTPLS